MPTMNEQQSINGEYLLTRVWKFGDCAIPKSSIKKGIEKFISQIEENNSSKNGTDKLIANLPQFESRMAANSILLKKVSMIITALGQQISQQKTTTRINWIWHS